MKSLTEILTELVGGAFEDAGFGREYGVVVRSNRPDLGDFQCNGALPAAGAYERNPREIAQAVVEHLDAAVRDGTLAEVNLAGPGFINLRLAGDFLAQHVQSMARDERLGVPLLSEPRRVIVDFGGANVAKRMHIGHLRPTIIGDSIQRLFRFRGDDVVSDIHMGDWGLQMGMLIAEIRRQQPDLPYFEEGNSGPFPESSPVDMADLGEIYPMASERTKVDPAFLEAARQATKELQDGRPGYRALWQHIVDVSIEALKEDFQRLGVRFDLWLGESHAHKRIEPLVERLLEQGAAKESAGAIIVDVAEANDKADIPPLMLLKSDGSVLYGTTDLATIEQRVEELNAELILYAVDIRQSLHFEQVFRAARLTGIAPAGKVGLEHLANGTINGPDGRPFRTRAGGVPSLKDVVDMVVEKARERLAEIDAASSYDEAEKEQIAEQVGIAALKFADLVNQRAKDYVFDLERFTSFEGRTGPYLLYTAVRTKSILRRAEGQGLEAGDILPAAGAEERELALKLAELPDVIAHAYETRAPNHLAEYVYNLAITFNRFYREYHILSEENAARQASWLALSQYSLRQIEGVLSLMGIDVPDRM